MNEEDYNTLVDIISQWKIDGEDIDPKQFINQYSCGKDEKKNYKSIEYDKDGKVVRIYLTFLKLSGPISESIGNLSQLEFLCLYNNQITGKIPDSIGNLSKLWYLDMSNNQITGKIPDSIGNLTKLRWLYMKNNQITGKLPESIGTISTLQKLYLSKNKLIGPIPDSIVKRSNLDSRFDPSTVMNKDEYNILVDIAYILEGHERFGDNTKICQQIGKNFTDELTRDNRLECSASGNIVSINLCTIDRIAYGGEWKKLSGRIPEQLGNLLQLRELDLSYNDLTGTVPQSLGRLIHLEKLNLSGNKKLSGALPSIVSSEDKSISTDGTEIIRVDIKTKPLNSLFDKFFVVSHVVIGYIDLVFDIFAIIALSSTNIPIMIANILFIALNVVLGVWISRDDIIGVIRIILQIDHLYQGCVTIFKGHQTVSMVVAKKIDAITRSVPSMILQLYGLLESLSISETRNNSLLHRFLSPSQVLLLSVASSIIGVATTLASLSPNSGDNIISKYFFIQFVYFIVEVTNRIVVLSVMFFSVGVYAYIVAGLDFLLRSCISLVFVHGNLRDMVLMAVQWFGSDRSVNDIKMLVFGSCMNTVEMLIFLIVLNTLKTPALILAKSQGASTALTVVACLTWLTRCIFYNTQILDKPSEPLVDKNTPMRESESSSSVSVSRVEDSDNMA